MRKAYLMENSEEAVRLDIKTDDEAVRRQANWLGIGPGARVLDLGCGSGHTAALLHELVQPGGQVLGLDYSAERLNYARSTFGGRAGLDFRQADILGELADLGQFDFIWVKFVLEYFSQEAPAIISKLALNLKPGGQLCLLDLDHNCLGHYPMPAALARHFELSLEYLADELNFDPYLGRKLYTYLYDAGYQAIRVDLSAHHLIYGTLRPQDEFNWVKKIDMLGQRATHLYDDYPGGFAAFRADFVDFFRAERRFTYTPLIMCQGSRPSL